MTTATATPQQSRRVTPAVARVIARSRAKQTTRDLDARLERIDARIAEIARECADAERAGQLDRVERLRIDALELKEQVDALESERRAVVAAVVAADAAACDEALRVIETECGIQADRGRKIAPLIASLHTLFKESAYFDYLLRAAAGPFVGEGGRSYLHSLEQLLSIEDLGVAIESGDVKALEATIEGRARTAVVRIRAAMRDRLATRAEAL